MAMNDMKRELQLYLWLPLFFSSLLEQGPPTCTSLQKRQWTTDSSGEEEEDENQFDYSSDQETADIAEDKSDDKLQQQKELWNGESMYMYILFICKWWDYSDATEKKLTVCSCHVSYLYWVRLFRCFFLFLGWVLNPCNRATLGPQLMDMATDCFEIRPKLDFVLHFLPVQHFCNTVIPATNT